MIKVSIRGRDAARCIATWDRVLFSIFRGPATAQTVAEISRLAAQLRVEAGAPVNYLSIVEATSPPPDDKARAELARFSREVVSGMAAAVIVAEGGGFRISLVRAVGVTLTMLMPHRVPFRFVPNTEQAIALITPHLSPDAGGEPALRRALAEVRAHFAAEADGRA